MIRNRRLLLILALGLVAPTLALAQERAYVDPLLRPLMDPTERERLTAIVARAPVAAERPPHPEERPTPAPGLAGLIAMDTRGPGGALRVGLLIRVRDRGVVESLRAAGMEVGSVVGDVVTGRVAAGELDRLTRLPGVLRVQGSRVVQHTHNLSMERIRASQVRAWDGARWRGFTGEGAIVGIVDTGLDHRHADFRRADGGTRVLGLWDQNIPTGPRPPPTATDTFQYGRYCSPADIDANNCPHRDTNGHGTHVAGTAVGNGLARGSDAEVRYTGVAPEADLLVVSIILSEEALLDAVTWVIGRARDLGRPVVVNLSLGFLTGPRDGSELFDRAVNQLSAPGRVIVASAGNHGSNHHPWEAVKHGTGEASMGSMTFTFDVPQYSPSSQCRNDEAIFEIWFPGEDRLSIGVRRPDGTVAAAAYGEEVVDTGTVGRIIIENAQDPDPNNDDIQAWIAIDGCGADETLAGEWRLEFTPDVADSGRRYHFWMVLSGFGSNQAPARGGGGFDNRYVVSSPATADSVIAVAAYVIRHCWTSVVGNVCGTDSRESIGDLAVFSSGGPTRDERLKPAIAAPGKWVISSRSADADISDPLLVQGGQHWALPGTSMAAPHVAGAVALMLQEHPDLLPGQIRAVLDRTAIQDDFTQRTYEAPTASDAVPLPVPEHWWGAGKIDVGAALADLGYPADPATIVVQVQPLTPPDAPVSRRGAVLPLIQLRLHVDGDEPVEVLSLGFEASGPDPDLVILLFRDEDGDGEIEGEEPLAGGQVPAQAPRAVQLFPDGLVVQPQDTTWLIAALEMSGAAPHAASFRLTYLPALTRTVGMESLVTNRVQQPDAPVATAPIRTTVLEPDEVFALNENPIRSAHVIFNFREPPRRAAIYTPDGRLVVDLLERRTATERMVWELRNRREQPVAPGAYLAIFEIGDVVVRERLLIVRPAGGS